MKKTKKITGSVQLPQTKRQWQLYQQISELAENLNRLPDAQEVKKNKPRSAPQGLLPMVF